MAVPQQPLDKNDDSDGMDDDERSQLIAAIDRSIAESEAGLGIPFEQAMAELRAKRLARARGAR